MVWSVLFFSLLRLMCAVDSAKILAVLTNNARSRHVMFQSVLKTLVEAGHHVTSYSPFPIDEPIENYTEVIILENVIKLDDKGMEDTILGLKNLAPRNCMDIAYWQFKLLYHPTFKSPELQRLFKSTEKFDLVIIERCVIVYYTLILMHIFKAPVLGILAYSTTDSLNSLSGNSLSMSFLPDICTDHSKHMGFAYRLYNAINIVQRQYYHYYDYLPMMEATMRQDFPDMPPLLEMARNVSLNLVNDHLTAEYAFPRTPNIIPVGGIHIRQPEKLPYDIQKFMDEAEEGVILFSLGTYVPDHLQPKRYFDLYLDAFSRLKQRVLWKTRKTDFENLPPNVLTRTWVPQQGILNHPKCVLFITHGGQHSHLETVHYGVPVIVIPQFFDQFRNARLLEDKGVGLSLNEKDVTHDSLFNAIQTVLGDARYGENMARLSAVFRDRPVSAARSVVYWVEYVVRHAGAPHLRPVSAAMPWYQRASLDVAATIILIIFFTIILVYSLINYLCSLFKSNIQKIKGKKLN